MARRTVDITVRVAVDEDQMRAVEDATPTAWAELLGTLVVALESIVDDNLYVHGTATATVGTPFVEHDIVDYGRVRRPAPGTVDDEQVADYPLPERSTQ